MLRNNDYSGAGKLVNLETTRFRAVFRDPLCKEFLQKNDFKSQGGDDLHLTEAMLAQQARDIFNSIPFPDVALFKKEGLIPSECDEDFITYCLGDMLPVICNHSDKLSQWVDDHSVTQSRVQRDGSYAISIPHSFMMSLVSSFFLNRLGIECKTSGRSYFFSDLLSMLSDDEKVIFIFCYINYFNNYVKSQGAEESVALANASKNAECVFCVYASGDGKGNFGSIQKPGVHPEVGEPLERHFFENYSNGLGVNEAFSRQGGYQKKHVCMLPQEFLPSGHFIMTITHPAMLFVWFICDDIPSYVFDPKDLVAPVCFFSDSNEQRHPSPPVYLSFHTNDFSLNLKRAVRALLLERSQSQCDTCYVTKDVENYPRGNVLIYLLANIFIGKKIDYSYHHEIAVGEYSSFIMSDLEYISSQPVETLREARDFYVEKRLDSKPLCGMDPVRHFIFYLRRYRFLKFREQVTDALWRTTECCCLFSFRTQVPNGNDSQVKEISCLLHQCSRELLLDSCWAGRVSGTSIEWLADIDQDTIIRTIIQRLKGIQISIDIESGLYLILFGLIAAGESIGLERGSFGHVGGVFGPQNGAQVGADDDVGLRRPFLPV